MSDDAVDAERLRQEVFREGLAEAVPIDVGWADVVISNRAINLCADNRKRDEAYEQSDTKQVSPPGVCRESGTSAPGRNRTYDLPLRRR